MAARPTDPGRWHYPDPHKRPDISKSGPEVVEIEDSSGEDEEDKKNLANTSELQKLIGREGEEDRNVIWISLIFRMFLLIFTAINTTTNMLINLYQTTFPAFYSLTLSPALPYPAQHSTCNHNNRVLQHSSSLPSITPWSASHDVLGFSGDHDHCCGQRPSKT